MTIRQVLKHGPCPDGRKWLKRYKTVAAAWKACPNGHWMAWFLHELKVKIMARAFPSCACGWRLDAGIICSKHLALDYANRLRAMYTSTGKLRKEKHA